MDKLNYYIHNSNKPIFVYGKSRTGKTHILKQLKFSIKFIPIQDLNSYEELLDKKYLQELILSKKNQEYNLDLLDFNYWKNLILNLKNLLEKDNDRI